MTTQWHLDICKYAFNLTLGDPTGPTNQYYGRTGVYGPDTFFSNFWQDIWHIVGVTKATQNVPTENIGYIHARDCGHCVDLHIYNETDVADLKAVRNKELDFVSARFDVWDNRK